MIWSTILFVCLLPFTLSYSVPNDLPKRSNLLSPRQAADPCCKSCGPIDQVLAECPTATTDVYCGCDMWVAAAPACEACIADVGFNSSYVVNPGPFLEWFWAFCRCQKPCRSTAEALSGITCSA